MDDWKSISSKLKPFCDSGYSNQLNESIYWVPKVWHYKHRQSDKETKVKKVENAEIQCNTGNLNQGTAQKPSQLTHPKEKTLI